ncbi:hypothetical protein C7S18_21445 [Ahniella affigens]|uniref:Uncharacterized protein n=1 Tax=Ahniella affigens TaxID=2021234 RepID=A0A2P1PXL1_9GAMM|nr:hypothetical protein C7S18_21445 [Ahniella affigens]
MIVTLPINVDCVFQNSNNLEQIQQTLSPVMSQSADAIGKSIGCVWRSSEAKHSIRASARASESGRS